MSARVTDEQVREWAATRADDAGRLALDLLDARRELAEARAALDGMFGLIENGYIVRDVRRDHEDGFAMRQLGPVSTLARAARIVEAHRALRVKP